MPVQQFIAAHWAAITFVSLYFFVAGVSVMPAPGDPRPIKEKLYEAFYQFLHVISNRVVETRPNLVIKKES
jgi:hypothetical protein